MIGDAHAVNTSGKLLEFEMIHKTPGQQGKFEMIREMLGQQEFEMIREMLGQQEKFEKIEELGWRKVGVETEVSFFLNNELSFFFNLFNYLTYTWVVSATIFGRFLSLTPLLDIKKLKEKKI